MNALAKLDLQPLDLVRAPKTLLLPEWLQRSVSALTVGSEEVRRTDGVMARRSIPVIAESFAPSKAMCAAIDQRLQQLREAKAAVDIDMAMAKVTELLLSFPGQALNESGAVARARGYITALEDLPVWAIADACRKWLRGDAGEQNYNFAPSPPQLRKIAEQCAAQVDLQIHGLERLLAAEIVPDPVEHSTEHCAEMLDRLQGVFRKCVADDKGGNDDEAGAAA